MLWGRTILCMKFDRRRLLTRRFLRCYSGNRVKKPLLPISIFVFFLLFSPFNISASQHEKAGDTLSGGRCETLGQVAQVCIGARDYQIFECKRAAEDDCQGILDRKEKLANSCNDCIPGVVGWLVETCEGRESQRTTTEFETQCTGPLKQLDEEYSKCRQTYSWKATGKGSCSVEGMVCSPQTSAGRRFDICSPGPDAYKDTKDYQTDQVDQKAKTQQVPSQDNNLAKEETPKQEENPIIQLVRDWTMETKTVPLIGALRFSDPSGVSKDLERFTSVTGKNLEETLNWQSLNTEEVLPNYIPGGENITVVKGQGEVKTPTSTQFILMNPKGGDTLQVTYLDSTVRSTSNAMQIQYIWAADSGSVINVPKWTEIKFLKPVLDEKTQEIKRMLKLDKGELEIKVKNIDPKNKFGVQGDFFDLFVVGTHFWVSQSQDKKMAVVGVYEGEVEVKTSDGKTVKVAPENGEPGVLVVSQKLSVVKLAIVGLVLAGAIGGVLFLKRKKRRK